MKKKVVQKDTLNICVVLSNVSCALFKRLKDSRDPCYLCAVTFTCWVDIPCTEGTTVERIFLRYDPLEVNSFGAGWCVISAPRPACDWTVQFLYFSQFLAGGTKVWSEVAFHVPGFCENN